MKAFAPCATLKPNFFSKYLDDKRLILLGINDYKRIQKVGSINGQKLDIYIAGLKSGEIRFKENNTDIEMDLGK